MALAEPDALLEVCVPDEPDELEEPELVADDLWLEELEEWLNVLFLLEVPLPPEPPVGVLEVPPAVVPFPTLTVGTTTGTRVLLTPAGWVAARVCEVTTVG